MSKKYKVDKFFFWIVMTLIIVGLIFFTSASLGVLAVNPSEFKGILFSQYVLGFLGGLFAMFIAYKIPYKFFRKYALILFIITLVLTALTLVPKLGVMYGGGRRWLSLFGFSFQPVELLKIGFIVYFASWLSFVKTKVKNPLYSILPLIISLGLIAFILVKQPDTKNIVLLSISSLTMLFVSGTPLKYILGVFGILAVSLSVLIYIPNSNFGYIKERINTFINPNQDVLGDSWQVKQSEYAIGSGKIWGKGLGQSIQKFKYLPEPQGDSIFAVIGEELGFLGSLLIICLYLIFALRGFRISTRNAPDSFSKLLVIGFITLITTQSFMNIAAISGIMPLTGVPLVFISHGGTALLLNMGMMGIILNISQYQGKPLIAKKS
jgi:cell division protein FtsW